MKAVMIMRNDSNLAYFNEYKDKLNNKDMDMMTYESVIKNKEMISEMYDMFKRYDAALFKKVFNYTSDQSKVNATVEMLLNKLKNKICDLEEEFNNVHDKIYHFGIVQKVLKDLDNNLDEDNPNEKYLMRITNMLFDTIRKMKSENITFEQFNIMKEAVTILISEKASKEDFINLDNKFLNNGLDWLYGEL